MTRVEITIKDNKVTFIEQKGDELPNPTWDEYLSVGNVNDEQSEEE